MRRTEKDLRTFAVRRGEELGAVASLLNPNATKLMNSRQKKLGLHPQSRSAAKVKYENFAKLTEICPGRHPPKPPPGQG